MTAPGVSHYSGLTLSSRIGPVERFPRPRSLANYFGLTPGCRNTGKTKDRLGSITKEGSKIARLAVMRRITTIFWHMLKYREAYSIGGAEYVSSFTNTAAGCARSRIAPTTRKPGKYPLDNQASFASTPLP